MKTRFILHGGFTPKIIQEDDAFFGAILKDAPQQVNVLLVYFAKELDRISPNREEDITQFNKNKNDKVLIFDTAREESFAQQAAWADVVYIHGGRSLKLLDALMKFPDLKSILNGKIVAADSAGVNVLSVVFYSQSSNGVYKGLGIIPFKTICHYTEVHKDKFNNAAVELEPLFLPEYTTKVYSNE